MTFANPISAIESPLPQSRFWLCAATDINPPVFGAAGGAPAPAYTFAKQGMAAVRFSPGPGGVGRFAYASWQNEPQPIYGPDGLDRVTCLSFWFWAGADTAPPSSGLNTEFQIGYVTQLNTYPTFVTGVALQWNGTNNVWAIGRPSRDIAGNITYNLRAVTSFMRLGWNLVKVFYTPTRMRVELNNDSQTRNEGAYAGGGLPESCMHTDFGFIQAHAPSMQLGSTPDTWIAQLGVQYLPRLPA